MKVSIFTLNGHYNYGNRLQNYALQELLKRVGVDVTTIWYDKTLFQKKLDDRITLKNLVKYFTNYNGYRTSLRNEKCMEYIEFYRMSNIKLFSDSNIRIDYDFSLRDNLKNEFDYFVDGSDQTWNPYFWGDIEHCSYIHFLRFAERRKRISYAASFGVNSLPPKHLELFKNCLYGFEHISVREQIGASIVKSLIGREVPVLVDPTITVTKTEWRNLELLPRWYAGEKYILTYFLGNVPQNLINLAKEYNYKIYNLMDYTNFNLYASKVEEFLWLIDNAELVCTDSFHACVFSILFNTPFLVVKRQQKGIVEMNSRLETLFDYFGYKDRFLDFDINNIDYDNILNMDFSNVEIIQHREINKSLKYLKQSMGI